jgi:hypothetical protein
MNNVQLKSKPIKKDLPVKRFRTQAAFEKWLSANHQKSSGVWLELAKKSSGVPSVNYAEALEVALCYGWIDGQTASVDAPGTASASRPGGPKASGRRSTGRRSKSSTGRGGCRRRAFERWRLPRRTAGGRRRIRRRKTESIL